ncbi:MAG: hypothetical protein QG670_366 [Thermoproteota archaeon]|nr:hypothetical protein [Thermoproteota archaeon]
MISLQEFFESIIDVPRMKVGKKQSLNSLICKETSLFARRLKDESKSWIPRLPEITLN